MQNVMNTLKFAVVGAALIAMSATSAGALSKKVKNACAGDYQDYCSQYVPDSTQARRCFESNHKALSKPCIRALVDAGEVPSKYLRK
jgi:hypothetical protein